MEAGVEGAPGTMVGVSDQAEPPSSLSNDLGRVHRCQGRAAARSLRKPGHGGHGQGRAATRRTGEEQAPEPARARAAPGQDHRPINVQLATVTRGQSRTLAVPGHSWSAALAARIGGIPKLIVRVRFSSPAPISSAQDPAMVSAIFFPLTAVHAIRVSVACHTRPGCPGNER